MESDLQKLRIDKSQRAQKNAKPIWPCFLLILLLIGAGIGVTQIRNAMAVPTVQTIRVRVPEHAPTSGPSSRVVLSATGYIIAAHKIELASKVIGRVAWVGVEMGDKVKKGQELVRLEDDEFKARVAQQQAQLDNAKAKFQQAESDWKRAQAMGASEALSQQLYDQYKADHAMAKAMAASSDAALALTKLDLENTTIRAPVDGTILMRNVEVGEFVTTGFVGDRGAKGYVVSLADLTDLRVELDISQNDFAKVTGKQSCWITTDAYPDRKYPGVVDLISPEANRQKATVLVRVRILNPDDLLKPDMNATVSFLLSSPASQGGDAVAEAPAVRIPSSAVRAGLVFVVENERAVARTVTAGLSSADGQIEIRKGLIGGEDLIVSPPATLKDGDAVKMQGNPS